jgi:hypothetical protein
MSYPIDGPRRHIIEPEKKEKCCSCWCFARKVKKIQQHEREFTQHQIDFTNIVRKEAFNEEKK